MISILALVWRATRTVLFAHSLSCISILALVWRATADCNTGVLFSTYFNPRPRVEGDRIKIPIGNANNKFQSSPSCGGRPFNDLYTCTIKHFNPRPRVEGDLWYLNRFCAVIVISILALVWRATHHGVMRFLIHTTFQSSPSCGGRLIHHKFLTPKN